MIVADDQRVVREGLTLMLGLIDGIEPVGAAADGEEALAMVAAERPDVVLMDLRMPRLDGIEATRRLAETPPGDRRRRADHLRRRRDRRRGPAGGRPRLPDQGRRRRADPQRDRAGRGRRGGDRPGGPAPADRGGPARRHRGPACPDGDELPDGLTPREAEVLELIAAGLSNGEIADRLVVSGATVKSHVNHLFAKIGARDRAQAVAYAYQHELVADKGNLVL